MQFTANNFRRSFIIAIVIGVFVFLFGSANSVFAKYILPPNPGGVGTCTADELNPDLLPVVVCQDAGIPMDNQCLQNPWTFKYATGCVVTYQAGSFNTCNFDYAYSFSTCSTQDRCYGSNTGASGSDPVPPGYGGRVLPGICNASSYNGSDPNSACVSGSTYKRCCSSGGFEPATSCSLGDCPEGAITAAGVTSCASAPAPPTPISVDIRANDLQGPITVSRGTSVTLKWAASGSPTSCTGSGAWSGAKNPPAGGDQSVNVFSSGTYTITCQKAGVSQASDSVTVNVVSSQALACAPTSQSTQVNQNVTLNASGGTGTYQWSGGGTPANGSGSSFTTRFSSRGAKSVGVSSGSGIDICTVNVSGAGNDEEPIPPPIPPPPSSTPTPTPSPSPPIDECTNPWIQCVPASCEVEAEFGDRICFDTHEVLMIPGWGGVNLSCPSGSTCGPTTWDGPLGCERPWSRCVPPPVPPSPPPPPPALDAAASFVPSSWNKQSFAPGEEARAKIRVTNLSTQNAVFGPTTLGVWPTGGADMPSCPGSPKTPPAGGDYSVAAIAGGQNREIDISFTVPSEPGGYTAGGYVVPRCDAADANWGNNGTGSALNVSFSYVVGIDGWFESVGGDVGSGGSVSVSQAPPEGRYQSSFLLAGETIDPKVKTEKWRISNYTAPLVPAGGVYTYLAERFLQSAKASPGRGCSIGGGNADGYNYCSGDAAFNAGSGPNGNSVWFIDGNLTISKDLTLGAGDSATFIVRGDITINSDVNRVDGIYVAGGTFSDYDRGNTLGAGLAVNGGVYAGAVDLSRKLGGDNCRSGPECDNTLTAADVFNFDAKYLAGLNNILGTPAVSWHEVAP